MICSNCGAYMEIGQRCGSCKASTAPRVPGMGSPDFVARMDALMGRAPARSAASAGHPETSAALQTGPCDSRMHLIIIASGTVLCVAIALLIALHLR